MAEAKAKVRLRHQRAISEFKKWSVDNPNAPRSRRIKHFDLLVDTAYLSEKISK